MKILVKAKPHAKIEKVERFETLFEHSSLPTYKVSVKAAPTDGKANDAIIRALADHFKVRTNDVCIVSGHTAGQKIIEISGPLL